MIDKVIIIVASLAWALFGLYAVLFGRFMYTGRTGPVRTISGWKARVIGSIVVVVALFLLFA